MNATSGRRIHRGKSRLGSMIAGHQQTADPTKARRSKILLPVIAASRLGTAQWVRFAHLLPKKIAVNLLAQDPSPLSPGSGTYQK